MFSILSFFILPFIFSLLLALFYNTLSGWELSNWASEGIYFCFSLRTTLCIPLLRFFLIFSSFTTLSYILICVMIIVWIFSSLPHYYYYLIVINLLCASSKHVKGHLSCTFHTPKHLTNNEKNIETHFAYEDDDSDYGHMMLLILILLFFLLNQMEALITYDDESVKKNIFSYYALNFKTMLYICFMFHVAYIEVLLDQ